MQLDLPEIYAQIDHHSCSLENSQMREVRLSHLEGYFFDKEAYYALLKKEDQLVYKVTSKEPNQGDGQLHYGMGCLMPGRVGNEYFLTKGHFHSYRPAAEIYIGLSGEGQMLLEDESTGAYKLVPFKKDSIVYVPGYTAHRTINTGHEPLTYIGVYPANAGHDYGVIAERNFLAILVDQGGMPTLQKRSDYSLN